MIDEYIAIKHATVNKQSKDKIRTRLYKVVQFFNENGIDKPTEKDIDILLGENINKLIKGRKRGNKVDGDNSLSLKTIRQIISEAKKYYEWKRQKESNAMENEIMNEQIIEPEIKSEVGSKIEVEHKEHVSEQTINDNNAVSVNKVGRPKTTRREEKFTLYMSKENMKNITMLANAYKITLTDLLNKLIDDFIKGQSKQLDFLREQERKTEEFFKTL